MPDNFIDLTVTSPPYDDLRTYNGYSFDFEAIAKELFRVTKPGGVVVWIVNDETKEGFESGSSYEQVLYFKKYCGFGILDTMIYAKKNPMPTNGNKYRQCYEFAFILSKGLNKTFNAIQRTTKRLDTGKQRLRNGEKSKMKASEIKDIPLENIWFYSVGGKCSSVDTITFEHPATFPEQLAADHIFSWSNEGDLVYDPFMGSGTTAKMAHLQKRNWIGSEISAEYVALAKNRIEPYLNQLTMF